MNVRSPATSFVAALDEPFRFVRARFSDWAPAAFGLAAVGLVPSLAVQWFNGAMVGTPGSVPDLSVFLWLFLALGAFGLLFAAAQLGAFRIVQRLLDGEPAGLGDALLSGLSPRALFIGGLPLGFVFIGFGCLVGGPLAGALVGFAPVVVMARPGAWFTAWSEAFTGALVRASPLDAGPPAYKLGAIVLIWYGINSVLSQLAVLPTFGWMGWNIANSLGSGDPMAALQAQPPFAISAVAAVLGAALRPFSDMYLAAACTILWRDVERVRQGAELEAVVDGRAA